jgi:AraC-like DNA-binding protein
MRFLDRNQKGARPAFKPTQIDRHTVSIATASGLSEAETAALVGVSRATLRTHFSGELRDGRGRELVTNLLRLDRAAQRASVSAAKFLVSCFSIGAPKLGGKKAAVERRA